ncbi:MAG TPA: hypothetical protein VF765_16095 [Polyangiaceae bacterium]
MVGAVRTLFLLAAGAGLAVVAACTSGTTADCSPDAGGTPNPNAWCGVPAGDATEMPESGSGGPTETGAGDAAPETGTGTGDAAPEGAATETGSPEAASDAPAG